MKIFNMSLILFFITFTLLSAPWDISFDQSGLKEEFCKKAKHQNIRLISVFAGKHTQEAKKAHEAYLSTLRELPCVSQVLPQQMLQDITELEDKAIVKKAKVLPINWVSVLRIYSMEGKFSASITLYDTASVLKGGFFIEKGRMIQTQENQEQAESENPENRQAEEELDESEELENSEYVDHDESYEYEEEEDRDSGEVILEVIESKKERYEENLKKFNRQYIAFQHLDIIRLQSGKRVFGSSSPVLGKYRQKLSWKRFYTLVGRDDLVEKYESNRRTATIFWIIGGVSTVMAPLFLIPDQPYSKADIEGTGVFSDEREKMEKANADDRNLRSNISLVFLSIGLINGAIGLYHYVNAEPISLDEARKLAIKYNEALMKDLNIPKSMFEKQSSRLKPSYSLTPYIGKDSGGVSLGIRF